MRTSRRVPEILRRSVAPPRRPRDGRPERAALVLTAVGAVALAGCGGSVSVGGGRTLDMDEVKATITKQYAAQGIRLSKLDCEDGVELKTGARITCSAANEKGTILNIGGSVTGTEGDGGRFRVRTVSAAASGTVIADKARSLLETKFDERARDFTCPATVPIPTKPSVTCELTTRDGTRYDAKVALNADAYLTVEVADRAKDGSGR